MRRRLLEEGGEGDKLRRQRTFPDGGFAGDSIVEAVSIRQTSPLWKDPIRSDEMAGISVGDSFQVVLVLRLGLPECSCRDNLGHNSAGP